MHGPTTVSLVAAAAVALAADALAGATGQQLEVIVNDRDNDAIWHLIDRNGNGVIDEPGEIVLFFNAANAAGTIGPMNPTCLAVSADRRVLVGDQINRLVYMLRDLNGDGDAQDAGESVVFADATNASGVSFAFPTGAAFDRAGVAYVTNAGNAFGDDGVYRLRDFTGNGDAQDAGEIELYMGFGGGNGPWSPQEILLDAALPNPDCYARNSSTGLFGIYIWQASTAGPGGAPAGFFPFWTVSTPPTPAPGAGFALERDRFRLGPGPGSPLATNSMYAIQTATGGIDQLVRCTQLNLDGDANDPGESTLVYSNSAAGFTAIDVASLPDGRVLISDSSADQIRWLIDSDSDGAFNTPGEDSAFFFANTSGTIADVRQIAIYRLPCPADFDGDGLVGASDLAILLGAWNTNGPYDLDDSGLVGAGDLAILLGSWGPCPIAQ